MTIHEKLATIQTKFKSKKSRFNAFGKYYFRSAEDILESIKPHLLKHGVTVTVNEKLIVDSPTPIIKTTAAIHDVKGSMKVEATAIVGVDLMQKGMQTPQQFGSASSYGKKYALGNLFPMDGRQLAQAKDYVKSGGTLDAIKKKYKLTSNQEKELTTL